MTQSSPTAIDHIMGLVDMYAVAKTLDQQEKASNLRRDILNTIVEVEENWRYEVKRAHTEISYLRAPWPFRYVDD